MMKKLMMGNEAAALGALGAGVKVICGYPGTPSSELLETAATTVKEAVAQDRLTPEQAPHVEWSVNEKAALEVAFGASLCGARALVTMKQVGLNVATDPLMTIAYLGVKGGLVLYVADDPGPISSQTEQDTRQFAQFAKVPVFDAASPEELYTMMPQAFELSEQYHTPVIVRATTRVCHGSAPIPVLERFVPKTIEGFERDSRWVIFPSLAYKAHEALPERLAAIAADAAFAALNAITPATAAPSKIGIVAGGVSWAYLVDALEQLGLTGTFDLLKIGTPFPLGEELVATFLTEHERVLVFEELEATIERELLRIAGSRQLCLSICGKLTHDTASAGENSVERIANDLRAFIEGTEGVRPSDSTAQNALSASSSLSDVSEQNALNAQEQAELLLPRPPVLCAGCPHRASFYAVKKALRGQKATYSGDIGCYTLGNALPLDMVDSCVCMGAGFTVPQGMEWAEPGVRHLGFVGDSTFFASGLTGVVNAVYNQAPVTLVVLDNSLTAMTGSQPHPGTGIRMSYDGGPADAQNALSIPRVLEALGLAHVSVVDPFDLPAAITAVKEAVAVSGVSALVFKAPCINVSSRAPLPVVVEDACTGCRVCIDSIGCPALTMDEQTDLIQIDQELCYGCDLCTFICPSSALESTHE